MYNSNSLEETVKLVELGSSQIWVPGKQRPIEAVV